MGIPKSWSVLAFSGCFFCAWATESLCFNEDLGFTREICCFPSSLGGNPACWDDFFYFEKCCVHFDAKDHSKEIETQITAQTYLQRCSQGKKDIFCDIAAVQISRDITSHLEALERNRWTWPMWQRHNERRSKGKHAGKISKMNNTCNEVELCQLVLLRSWDIETRRGLVSLPDGPEKVAWCTHQASILRALDPDRFSELNSDSVQVDTYYVRWLVRCQEMQKARLVFGLSGMSFEGEPFKTNTKKPKVAVHLAVAGKAAIDFAHFVKWWRCYAEKHDYHFFMDQEVLAGDLLGPVHATGPLSGLLPRDEERFSNQVSRYAWFKWLSAKRHLERDDVSWLIIVDPDMVPSPGCGFEIPIVETYGKQCCNGSCWCDVLSSDFLPVDSSEARRAQDKNAGFLVLRNSKIGRMLLDLALERRTWSGLGMPDQDAIGEALLELMSLDNEATGGQIYRNECMRYMFLNPQSHALISGFGYVSANYGRCWMIEAERLQKRRSRFLGLINPLEGNLNALPYFRGFWQVPYGGWDRSFPAHTSPGFGLGTASREEKWREGANALLLLHFAGLGSTKLSLMAWGIRAHYGLRPNASCIQLNAIATRPRIATQPPCMPLRVWQAM